MEAIMLLLLMLALMMVKVLLMVVMGLERQQQQQQQQQEEEGVYQRQLLVGGHPLQAHATVWLSFLVAVAMWAVAVAAGLECM
jgi:hypothetical protein